MKSQATSNFWKGYFLLPKDIQQSEVAAETVRNLSDLATAGYGTVAALMEMLPSVHAQLGLARIGRPAVTALSAALGRADRDCRVAASLALGEMGPDAAEAIPVLRTLLEDSDDGVRGAAAEALRCIMRQGSSKIVGARRS